MKMGEMTVYRAGTGAGTGGYSDALDYLRSVYNDPLQPTHIRMKAAAMSLEFERPRLAVTASLNNVRDFAEELEQRRRSRNGRLIEARPNGGTQIGPTEAEQISAEHMNRSPYLRRRPI